MGVTYVVTFQGGSLFLETTSLETLISYFAAYLRSITFILFGGRPMNMTRLDDHPSDQGNLHTPLQANGKQMQGLIVNVSQLSTVIITVDEKGMFIPSETVLLIFMHHIFHVLEMLAFFCRWCSRTCA